MRNEVAPSSIAIETAIEEDEIEKKSTENMKRDGLKSYLEEQKSKKRHQKYTIKTLRKVAIACFSLPLLQRFTWKTVMFSLAYAFAH